MHPHTPQNLRSFLRVSTTTAFKLLAVSLLVVVVPAALYVRVKSEDSAKFSKAENSLALTKRPTGNVTVQAAGRGKPYLNLQDGRKGSVEYLGDRALTSALQNGAAQARSLASADFDRNGTPDVVAGYGFNGAGMITIQRGNPDAFAPADDSVFVRMQQGYNPESLLPVADVYPVPVAPDFLVTGNFTSDSEKDVVVAAKGGGLYLLTGDGAGRLGEAQQIDLPGSVTALAAGEFRAADGFTDLAVGVNGPGGDELLIFDDGVDGFSKALVQYRLSQPASAIEFGGLDDDPFQDVALAAGSEVIVVHGWGRKEEVAAESRVERVNVGPGVRGLALGQFVWDREGRSEIAALTYDGTVHIVENGKLDTRPFSEVEAAERTRGNLKAQRGSKQLDVESAQSWKQTRAAGWIEGKQFLGSNLSSDLAKPLMRTNLSYREMDEVMLVGQAQSKLEILRPVGPNDPAPDQSLLVTDGSARITLDVESTPVAVLPLPRKLNGVTDVVLLSSTSSALNIVPNAPNTTITVDRTDDPSGAGLTAASACTAALNDCSLRGALEFANLPQNNNTTISLPANTYILSINGTTDTGCTLNSNGDLGANQTMSIVGAGAATTIIRQTGTGPANDGDRIMCMSENFAIGLVFNFSGVTFVGGRDGTAAGTGAALGGGGIIGGELNNSLTLTNVVMANNQVTVLGSANIGGGGIQITGGNLIITNSTFGGSSLPGAYTDRTSTNTGNLQGGSGGGVMYTPSSPQHSGGTGTLTVTGSTFSRNTVGSVCCGGGGLDLVTFAFAAPGGIGTGTASIGTSTISNNQANPGNGGGIDVESLPTTVATTSITNNSAGNRGGGIYVGGGSLLLNGTTPSITFSGNTATNAGSSISTAGPVNVDGTNTTIGGDIEVSQGGVWTNNTGSTLAPTNVVVAGGTLNMNNSTMNVSGNLTIGPGGTNGGTFNGNTGTVNIQGNFVLNAGGVSPATNLSAGTGTFNFNGTGAQSISNGTSITFFNLTDSNITQPLTANNSFNVNGSLNVNGASAIFNPVAAAVIGGTGTLTGTGTARVTRTAATADFSSQYTITNKTLTNLTVEYIGTAAQVLSAITYGPLKINNANGVTLATGTSTVNGLLTLSSGALGVGNQTLVINDGSSVGAGSITSNPTGTVNYNQTGDGQNVRAFNYGNLTFSNFNKVLEPTGTIGIAGLFTPGTATGHTITGSTINFNGTGAQTVPAFNYNNLTISGARGANNVTLVNGGTVGVAGLFNPTATFAGGNYVVTNNTVDFNGSGAQTIPAFNYFNLTSSNAGARTLQNSGIIGIASVFTPGTNVYTIAGSTVAYNGTSAQTLPSSFTTYFNLTSNNAAGVTGFAGLTVQALLRVQTGTFTSSSTYNNVQIDSGATLAGTNGTTINVGGNWTNNGTFTANTNTVNFNGSGAQVIGGSSVTTFNNLTIANAVSGVSLGQNANVNAVLTLTNDLTTGANILTMPNTGTSAGTADVIGNVRRTGFAGGGPALSFGNPFNSIGFIAQGTVPTDILVNLVKAVPAGFPGGASLLRTYTITPTGGAGFSATLRLHYLDAELNGNIENQLGLFRNTPPWVRLGRTGAVDIVNNWAELSGVTQFSAWTLSSARNNTTTEITADTPDPSQINESVTINFKVLSAVAGAPQVTGNVTITVNDASGDTCTGTINPVDGTGTCNIAFTTFGLKTLTATYNADDNFNTSTDTESHEVDEPDVTVAVSPASVLEDGPDNLVYTFTREGPTTSALTVNFTAAGTASSTSDYALTGAATFDGAGGTVTIPIGSSTTTLTVNPTTDSSVEADETAIVNVAAGTGYDVGTPGSATGTITNDDTDVSVAVAPSSTSEDGAGNLVYTFTRAGVTTGALTANFTINGTAIFNTDYTQTGATTFTPPNGTVQFAAGSSTATVTVDPTADTTVEPDETVILAVAPGTGYNVAAVNNSATGTITNDDTDVSLAVAPASVAEDGATNLVYTFTRVGVTSTPLTANFTIGGTATFSNDYTQTGAATFVPPNGTVTFGAGNSTATVTVDPTADITSEPDETVILTLAAGTGYNVVAPSSATGTITNDDVVVSVAVSPGAVDEDGATNLVYTFTRNDSAGALAVNFSIGGTATFNADYAQTGATTFVPPNGTVSFADGSLTTTVTVDPVADSTVEPDETVVLTVVAGAGYGVGAPSQATGTITNDDTDVSVAVAPLSVNEDGATNLVYTFTRTGVTTGALTANFTINGTATFNTDYTQTGAATFAPPNGTVQFAAGSSTATVTVDPTADTTVEPNETVILTVAPGTGYNVGTPSAATGTITNDDTDVSLAVAPASVAEDGATNLVYTFTRVGVTSTPLTANFTIGGTATFSNDYTQTGAATFVPPNGTVTFGAGNSTATITVDPTADITSEPDETVILTLAAGTGYNVVAPSSATGTITNDDIVVSVAVSPGAVDEDGATNLVYTFTRNDSNGPLTANFSIGGTATFNTDYTQSGAATFVPPNGTVTFANGSLTTTVTIDPVADSTVEPDETVILTVVAGAGYVPGAPTSATGTITNDDTDVSVAVAPSSTAEDGAGNLVYTFTRTGVTTGALTANFTIGGTATFNTDYTQSGAATFAPPNGTVQFAAGSSTATVTVDPTVDTTVEPDETVVLTVAPGTGYGVGAPSSATGTITNDDTDVSVAVAPASVPEDGPTNLVYTFTRNGVTSTPLTVNFTIGGTATFNTDYTQVGAATFVPPNGTVTFGAGNSTATVTVNPTADMTSEPDETVILTVAAGTGYNVASPSSATGTIANDDAVDVEITAKTDAPDPVCVGANITYTIGFRNNASGAAINAKVSDTIPANTTFVSATLPAGWSRADAVVAGGTGTLMFTNPSAAGGSTASFTVVVKVNAGVLGGTIISNTATASSDAPDDVPGNNSKTATTTVDPNPPVISGLSADPSSLWPKNHKMRDVTINYTATDSCGGVNCQITSITSNEPINGTADGDTSPDWEFVDSHNVRLRAESAGGSTGRIYTITVTCTDAAGNTTTKTVEVHVGHNIITPTSGTAFKINTAVTFTGTFWDVPGRTHRAVWQFDDLTTGATVTEPVASKNGLAKGTYTFRDPGVYKVSLKVTDNTGVTSWIDTQDDVEAIVVIYDPSAGYTIGGGWIASPLGALVSDPTMIGKLSFGFNSKFFKNATNPKGESQIDFLLGALEFNALNYDYLVISQSRAQFRGFGKINGSAGYDFMLTVIDGGLPGGDGVDKFRVKIWEKATGVIVYDNQMGASDAADPITPVGPGADIVIKK